jgi:hypothetical protein
MTRQEQIDLIRAACIEANPSDTTLREQNSWQGLQIKRSHGRPIRLADVLLAMDRYARTEVCVGKDGSFCVGDGPKMAWWKLRKDDLTEQSDECVAFLAQLLG